MGRAGARGWLRGVAIPRLTREGISDALAHGGRPEAAHGRFEIVQSIVEYEDDDAWTISGTCHQREARPLLDGGHAGDRRRDRQRREHRNDEASVVALTAGYRA